MSKNSLRKENRKERTGEGRRRRGLTPWKKTVLWFCLFFLILAGVLHLCRIWRSTQFQDQNEASRWGNASSYAQVSAFLSSAESMKQEDIMQLEYALNTALAQDSIKLDSDREGARLWQDCYAGLGKMTLSESGQKVEVEAVGTGGAFFQFHPLVLSSGSYYSSTSLMKDEILLDQETAWRIFGSFDVVGRTVHVGDTNLRISGVFKKEEGSIYEEAGMPGCLVFVQYRTLVKYAEAAGSGGSDENTDSGNETEARVNVRPVTNGAIRASTRPSTAAAPRRIAADDSADEEIDMSESGAILDSGDEDSGSAAGSGTGSSDLGDDDFTEDTSGGTGTGAGDTGTGTGTGTGAGNGNSNGSSEYVGKGNTEYKDKGRITIYEIVMPNPVEGYAAGKLREALGEESSAVVVDNTNRFGTFSLLQDLRDLPLMGMRTQEVRFPYWENAARGYEMIFAILLLAECLLVGLTVLLLVWMFIHYLHRKTWTLVGNLHAMQDDIYERQSRKRYPEYYEEKDKTQGDEEE